MQAVITGTARGILWCALGFWVVISLLPNPRPDPVPTNAPADEFSAERAMVHVAEIAQRPHPVGSPDHARVRDYVRAEMARLGLATEVQTGIGEYSRRGHHASGPVENIVGRLAGTANTRPLMLTAHYDSVPTGPGAGDDAHGVAVLLETLRALRTGPPLRNDIIFLVTDGEERGLLGADVFVREHPWRHDPALVLNFEARGTSGPSYMFETSPGNAWLIEALRTAVPRAEATSVAYEIYRRMPNDTDLTVFKRAGMAGMNFAFIGHPEFYHRPQDDVEHLDHRSVQENGNYALRLARIFGNEDLRWAHLDDAVYFPTRLTHLIVYPGFWVMPLAWTAVIAQFIIGWLGMHMRRAWLIIAPFAIVTVTSLLLANAAPGASFLLEWPVMAGLLSLFVLASARGPIGLGWRLVILSITPGVVLLLVVPFLSTSVVALGWRGAAPVLVAAALLVVICLQPQLRLLLGRNTV